MSLFLLLPGSRELAAPQERMQQATDKINALLAKLGGVTEEKRHMYGNY